MRLISCPKCQSQFDVSAMTPGTSFTCGKCRNVLEVPAAGPVVQPVQPAAPRRSGAAAPPATVMMSADEMKKALAASRAPKESRGRTAPPATVMMTPEAMQAALAASKDVKSDHEAEAAPIPTPGRSGSGRSSGAARRSARKPAKAVPRSGGRRSSKPAGRPAATKPPGRPAAARPAAARPTAASSSQPRLPKAMQKRAAAADPSSQKRAGATQQIKAEATGSRGGRSGGGGRSRGGGGRRSRPERETKKSNTGLIVGAVAGVAVLGAAAFFLMGNKDDESGGGAETAAVQPGGTDAGGNGGVDAGSSDGGAATSTSGGSATAATAPQDEYTRYLALGPTEQNDAITEKLVAAGTDVARLKEVHDFFTHERMNGASAAKKGARRAAEEALKHDKDLDWAREAQGQRDGLKLVRDAIEANGVAMQFGGEAQTALSEAAAELESEGWVDKKRYAELEALIATVAEFNSRAEQDPRFLRAQNMMGFIRENDLFKEMNFIFRYDDPYVIYQNYNVDEFDPETEQHHIRARREKAQLFARRDGIIFGKLNENFRDLFADRFSLPTLRDADRLLRVIVLWDREKFQEYHSAQGEAGPGAGARAYYSPVDKHIVHYVGTEGLTETGYFLSTDGFFQPLADQVTCHEGLHQLMHEYSAITRGSPLTDGVDAVPPRKSMWFSEGLAEFMGSIEVEKDKARTLEGAKWRFNRILCSRVGQMRSNRRNKGPLWTLPRMLEPNHNGDLNRIGGEIAPGRENWMANLFYGHSWAFTHFCWNYNDGQYREKLLKYMGRVLKNTHSPEAFAECFELPSPKDFGKVKDEFDWYFTKLLNRQVETDRNTRVRPEIDTSPPAGKLGDDDDDWDSDWDDEDGDDEEM